LVSGKTSILIAFYILSAIVIIAMPVSRSYGQLQTNVTTTCSNGNCTTTICVDTDPCKITNSNSTNITTFGDLLKNKTIPMPPEEVV
jgi:hypothetical protein